MVLSAIIKTNLLDNSYSANLLKHSFKKLLFNFIPYFLILLYKVFVFIIRNYCWILTSIITSINLFFIKVNIQRPYTNWWFISTTVNKNIFIHFLFTFIVLESKSLVLIMSSKQWYVQFFKSITLNLFLFSSLH